MLKNECLKGNGKRNVLLRYKTALRSLFHYYDCSKGIDWLLSLFEKRNLRIAKDTDLKVKK